MSDQRIHYTARNSVRTSMAIIACSFALCGLMQAEERLSFSQGDRICYIGNTLADRMQHHGWLETILQNRFPEEQLVFRNLGFAADELTVRPRSMNFGSPDSHLKHSQADVVFAFFGYNEAARGEDGLPQFKRDLAVFVGQTLGQQYNGKSAPRLVLFSPIAHENLNDPNLPDGTESNSRLAAYAKAMAAVAAETGVPFVDLFTPTKKLFAESPKPLTINGIHLTPEGNRQLAEIIDQALFGVPKPADETRLEDIRQAVLTKNLRWFNRYRTTDGYSTYGKRAFLKFVGGQTNYEVMQHELKMLDVMTANRDKVVWAAAQGREIAIDDSNVPKPLKVISNVGGGSRSSSAMKEGSLKYLGGEEAIAKMKVAEGMSVNLFASEEQFPELINPVQQAVDPDGRLWVAAWTTYPHWDPMKPLNDKLLIFPDEDGDGKADRCVTFADELHNPTGFEFWNGGVLVACQPEILFLKDTDGDDKADVRIHYLQGIDSADTHCGANSFTLGPDGCIYFSEGIFHFTNVETPWGKPLRTKAPMLYRWNPRTHAISEHFRVSPNPHGIVIDEWGYLFATDGTTGQGFYAGYPNAAAPHQLYKKRVRPVAGFGQITGTHFPEANRGNLLICNTIGVLGVLQHKISVNGADYTSKEVEPILLSSDKNFRPVDVEIGGDGALYVLDWQNVIIGHMQHNLRDPNRDHKHGRIYRVTVDGRPLTKAVELGGKPIPELLAHLESPEHAVRYRARIELSGRDSEAVLAAARQWAARFDADDGEDGHHLLEALWLHEQHNRVNGDLLKQVLRSPQPQARAAAARVAGHWAARYPEGVGLLQAAARDEDARVRHEAVVAAAQFQGLDAAEIMFEAALRPSDPQLAHAIRLTRKKVDRYWQEALKHGQSLSPAGQRFVLRDADVATLTRMARTKAVCQALLGRAGVDANTRADALQRLAELTQKTRGACLLEAMHEHAAQTSVIADLVVLARDFSESELVSIQGELLQLGKNGRGAVRAAGMAALIQSGMAAERVDELLATDDAGSIAFLQAVPLVELRKRPAAYPLVRARLGVGAVDVRQAALNAAKAIPGHAVDKFADAARMIQADESLAEGLSLALSVPEAERPASPQLLRLLVAHAHALPRDALLAPAMEPELALIDQLAAKQGGRPSAELLALRRRLPSKIDPHVLELGAEVYEREAHCATCHQANGEGLANVYPPLAGSRWVTDSDVERLIKVALHGMMGEITVRGKTYKAATTPPMTPFKDLLNDEEMAAVLSYVRNSWGNRESAVTSAQIAAVREANADRSAFWSEKELLAAHPFTVAAAESADPNAQQWVVYQGGQGPGKGKHAVFVSGDEEYRSEESLPQLAKILSQRHGFKCTVLFAIDPKTGEINPDYLNNIPGMAALDSADLMVVNIRFRDLPPAQMKHFDAFLKAGKPVIAIRPTLAGFVIRKHKQYAHYDWHYKGPERSWRGGFGQAVLGQTWMAHHGKHKHQGTRGLIADSAKSHPLVRGIADGDVWGSTDVYRTPQPVPEGWTVLINGQVTDRAGAFDPKDKHFGQKPTDPVTKDTKQNNPIMPIAWLRSYQIPGGKQGLCLYETIGASTDFESEGLRRLTVNAAYYLLGLEVPEKANVATVGDYKPTAFGFRTFTKGVRPADHALSRAEAERSERSNAPNLAP